MGVHGLWELLSPVGRRVSVETLAGKRLAIDASIWMVQFMKAMRDERGEMVRNGHLLGFFRRICKLLFLRTKPVFVFDGATPELKRRTVANRRRHRDSAQAKVRKTAEKLLLNHLKAMKLQELADNIKNQRQTQKSGGRGKKVLPNQSKESGNKSGENGTGSVNYNQGKLDRIFEASVMTEENESLPKISAMFDALPCNEDDDEDEEMILPDMIGEVDPDVLASLTPSLQLDLLQKQKRDNDAKGKKIMSDNSQKEDMVPSSFDQEKIDEMLAASLMEEEKRSLINNASSNSSYPVEEGGDMDEDEDEDEEMIVPPMDGGVDPSILASLPPSMQLDLLVQIRERLMAENRQKYQKVKKDPGKFSELQIEAYLKTVAFRREIDQVQKAASGRGVGGVQTSRIASEANREFIFSSSFTGDKQELVSGQAEKRGEKQRMAEELSSTVIPTEATISKSKSVNGSEERSSSFMRTAGSTSKSKTTNGSEPNRVRRAFDDSIETYLDEQGRVRVSRVRAMGIHMTRDLQRNLDLMKEIELERENVDRGESNSAVPTSLSGEATTGTSHDVADSIKLGSADENSVFNGDALIEISFEDDDDIKGFDGDDVIFTRLAAEIPVGVSSDNINPPVKQSSASDSDCDWEEGTIEASGKTLYDDSNLGSKPLYAEGYNSDGSEVEWEEGGCEDSKLTASPFGEKSKLNSKGYLVEEAELQEAIRRSLGDLEDQKSDYAFSEVNRPLDSKHRTVGEILLGNDGIQKNTSTGEILDVVGEDGISKTSDAFGSPLKSSIVRNPNEAIPSESRIDSPKQSMQDANKCHSLSKESPDTESIAKLGVKEVTVGADQKTAAEAEPSSHPSGTEQIDNPDHPFSDDQMNELIHDIDNEEKLAGGADQIANQDLPFSEEQMIEVLEDIDNEMNLAAKKSDKTFQEVERILENSALEEDEDWEVESAEAQLEEELKILSQERLNLGNERRRFERNAESVSGEMFIECQELLQMFGIPYIISPMEAEAQCAFLEIANLVDGVVTDDSDVFLFGAQSVYKNIFDDRKYVETYFMKDIENELGLSREKLIRMALLLGSDYTEGVSGIGIVNAIEVLNAFPKEDGLKEFREWIESPDPTILGKVDEQPDSKVRKKASKTGKSDSSQRNAEEVSSSHENSGDDVEEAKKMFMDKHRKVSKNWHMPPSFPSEMVISAYLSPEIDKSTEPFSWGKPDHFVLRKLCWEKFGWDSHKADELILPVLKEYNKRETQLRMEAFYTFNERFAKIRSKRIKKAVKGITGKKSSALMDDSVPEASGSKNKRKSKNAESGDDQPENVPNVINKSTFKQSRKRTKLGHGNVSVGSKTRTQTSRRGKGKESPTFELSETSSGDDEEVEVLMETRERSTQEGSVVLRRSRRARKTVDYAANDSESDDLNNSVNEGPENIITKEASYASELAGSGPHFPESVSPEKGSGPDYYEKGGGFCLDDVDNDQLGSEEYLQTGGGFCLDEDETRPDENNTDMVQENDNLSQSSAPSTAFPEVSEPIINSSSEKITEQSKSRSSAGEYGTDHSQIIPAGALRAMPRLRKKRRT